MQTQLKATEFKSANEALDYFLSFFKNQKSQQKSLETKLENMEKHNILILRQRNELTKLLLSQTSEFDFSSKQLLRTTWASILFLFFYKIIFHDSYI